MTKSRTYTTGDLERTAISCRTDTASERDVAASCATTAAGQADSATRTGRRSGRNAHITACAADTAPDTNAHLTAM